LDSQTIQTLLPAIGGFSGAAAIGALLGYGFKKLLKVLLVILAGIAAIVGIPLGYLTYKGIITVNWNALYTLMQSTVTSSASFIASLIQTVSIGIPVLGGFGTGFAVGFQKG
jgi:uncharacterized membrane protein (Fun14 family)